MRPKTCGECEHFLRIKAFEGSGICRLAIVPSEISPLLKDVGQPPDICPLPAEPVPMETGVSLDELQNELGKTLALLRDRQPGLMSWNMFLGENLRELRRLASDALGEEIEI